MENTPRRARRAAALALSAALLANAAAGPAAGNTQTWKGGDGNWSGLRNWSEGQFNYGDDVSFGYGQGTIRVVGRVSPGEIRVNGGAYTIRRVTGTNGAITATSYKQIRGTLSLDLPVAVNDRATLGAGTLSLNDVLTAKTFTQRGGTLVLSGDRIRGTDGSSAAEAAPLRITGSAEPSLALQSGTLLLHVDENAQSGDAFYFCYRKNGGGVSRGDDYTITTGLRRPHASVTPAGDWQTLRLEYGNMPVVWSADSGAEWIGHSDDSEPNNWTRSPDVGAKDWYWDGDTVYFTPATAGRTVVLSRDESLAGVYPDAMTVTGSHTFDLSAAGLYVSRDLTVSGAETEAVFTAGWQAISARSPSAASTWPAGLRSLKCRWWSASERALMTVFR